MHKKIILIIVVLKDIQITPNLLQKSLLIEAIFCVNIN